MGGVEDLCLNAEQKQWKFYLFYCLFNWVYERKDSIKLIQTCARYQLRKTRQCLLTNRFVQHPFLLWIINSIFLPSKLLGVTIQHEKPQLEVQKTELLRKEEELKVQLAELEESLLEVRTELRGYGSLDYRRFQLLPTTWNCGRTQRKTGKRKGGMDG